jgi:hypothetical protein
MCLDIHFTHREQDMTMGTCSLNTRGKFLHWRPGMELTCPALGYKWEKNPNNQSRLVLPTRLNVLTPGHGPEAPLVSIGIINRDTILY